MARERVYSFLVTHYFTDDDQTGKALSIIKDIYGLHVYILLLINDLLVIV